MSPLTREILEQLIVRHERPGRQNVARVRLNERQHPAYFSQTDVSARAQTHQELLGLAQQGVITLHWKKWETGNLLAAVDVTRVQDLYVLLNCVPRSNQVTALQQLLETQPPRGGWHTRFLEWTLQQLKQNRSPAPLTLQDTSFNRDLLTALDAIVQLRAPILERALSVRLFADSKRLASLQGSILTILRRFDTDAALYEEDVTALLRAHYVERAPEYVPLAGAVRLRIKDQELDLTPFTMSIALPADLLRATKIIACNANVLVTVENLSSFNDLIKVHVPDSVIVYTGGFASPSVITFLKTMRQAYPQMLFVHWGDMDVGGLRILAHLRANLGHVLTTGMNAEILVSHRPFARPLILRDRKVLQELRNMPLLKDCIPLIDTMLLENLKLEQEALDPKAVLQNIQMLSTVTSSD